MSNEWYKELVVYQIWCRSFKDGNGDGAGDLYGVLEKLDYIKSLGVNAIWFSPIYPSPNADWGYDVSDYKDIHPDFGDADLFRKVVDEAHKRDMKIIMDLVVNHTSSEHYWFKESRKSRDNPYSDYYIWKDGKNGGPPNNWTSLFEGGAWEYVPERDQYYMHAFAKGQPDLNMDNPKVREEVKDIMRFWLDMGVDGFREDVITFISKDPDFPNGFPLPIACGIEHYNKGPNLMKYLKEFREDVIDKYDCFVVAESPMTGAKDALRFTSGDDKVFDMMISFDHMNADCFMTDTVHLPFSLRKFKKALGAWQTKLYGKAWNALYIENHDHPRVISRYGSEEFRAESGKMLATAAFLMSGTPFIYQGQEIGMTNIHLDSIDRFPDVSSVNTYALMKSMHLPEKFIMSLINYGARDNGRTPVQWSAAKNGGFTTADKPWFEVNPNYPEINVEAAEADPNSILHYYRKLLRFRKENEIVRYGDFRMLKTGRKLFAYIRRYNGQKLLVVCSFAEEELNFRVAESEFDMSKAELVLCNYDFNQVVHNGFFTRPYETRVYLLK